MNKLSKLLQLSGDERRILFQACLALPLVASGIRLFGFNRVQTLLAGPMGTKKGQDCDELHQVLLTARMVRLAADYGICRASCLSRSITLWWLLRRHGIASDMHIGVRKTMDRLEAHAWVEKDGTPLNEDSDIHERFAAFTKNAVNTNRAK